jgi:membrane-bound lytic murein transglycosylase D
MKSEKCIPTKRSLIRFATFSLVCLLAISAWASRNLVQDRKITMSEAQQLIKSQDDFPLIVNDDVLVQLNKYLGTPEGRTFIKESLKRKTAFADILKEKSKAYGTPDELNAIPIVESGFINRTSTGRIKAAGLWMFIPGTARRYGMIVNKTVDERLNVEKETDAAQRYLLANHVLFKDWHLSLLAYNIGEGAVQKGIKKFNTRNAWELVANGVEGDKNYLPSVMAAMIIMRNPELLQN